MNKKSGCGPLFGIIGLVIAVFALLYIAPITQGKNAGSDQWFKNFTHTAQTAIPVPSLLRNNKNGKPSPTKSKQKSTTLTGSCFDMARQAATQEGINPDLYARQINQESGCTDVGSSAGAQGVAQLMPLMSMSLGVDPHDTQQSLRAGAHLMAGYLKRYSGSWALALACYNAGSNATAYALKTYGENWLAHLPLETQNYVHNILG